MSVTRRRPSARLRIDTFEDRVVPTIGVGVSVDSFGVAGGAPDGNSGAVGPNDFVQFTAGNPNVGPGSFTVFDKAGNVLLGENDTAFWAAAGISSSYFGVGLSEPRAHTSRSRLLSQLRFFGWAEIWRTGDS